jgi:hypothetical protein
MLLTCNFTQPFRKTGRRSNDKVATLVTTVSFPGFIREMKTTAQLAYESVRAAMLPQPDDRAMQNPLRSRMSQSCTRE